MLFPRYSWSLTPKPILPLAYRKPLSLDLFSFDDKLHSCSVSIFYGIHEISSAYIFFLFFHCNLQTICLGKSCSVGLLCVPFVDVYQSLCVLLSYLVLRMACGRLSISVCSSSPFGFEGGMWDLIVLIPGHKCISIYFSD